MCIQIRRSPELLEPQLFEIMQRGAEAELDVGEEEVRAAEDEAAGGRGVGGELGGEEVEDGGDVGGVEGWGEELGGEEGEPREVRFRKALGLEEIYGGEDLVCGVGEGELFGVGLGGDDTQRFEIAEVFAVGCTELDEV